MEINKKKDILIDSFNVIKDNINNDSSDYCRAIGDIIIEADGQKVENMNDLNTIKNSHQIGDKMTLKIYRDGKESTVELTLAEQP